jgi:uncharacterized protein (TIGR03437 family)
MHRQFSKIILILLAAAAIVAAQPVIFDGGVLNGASFSKGVAVGPGSLVSIFGSNLASGLQSGDTVPLSNTINNVSVSFNGIPAGLYFVSGGQVNAQLPWNVLSGGATTGNVNAVVTVNGAPSAPLSIPVNNFSPGIFTIPPGVGYAIAINPDGSLAAPVGSITGFPTHPAKVGDTLIVLATGLGPVDSPIANGAASLDKLRNTLTLPTVTIGGTNSVVGFSGLSPQFPGINQLNVVVPSGVNGASLDMRIAIGGVTSPTGATIAVGN